MKSQCHIFSRCRRPINTPEFNGKTKASIWDTIFTFTQVIDMITDFPLNTDWEKKCHWIDAAFGFIYIKRTWCSTRGSLLAPPNPLVINSFFYRHYKITWVWHIHFGGGLSSDTKRNDSIVNKKSFWVKGGNKKFWKFSPLRETGWKISNGFCH